MSKKLNILIIALLGSLVTAVEALLSYFQPPLYGLWITAVGMIGTTAAAVINLFTIKE